jgi:hypothetical protein
LIDPYVLNKIRPDPVLLRKLSDEERNAEVMKNTGGDPYGFENKHIMRLCRVILEDYNLYEKTLFMQCWKQQNFGTDELKRTARNSDYDYYK